MDAELAENLHHVLRLLLRFRRGDVADMQDEVGLEHLLERGAESRDQHRRQVGDEADRVGEDHLLAVRQPHAAERRVERREEHVLREDVGAGQPVEQRRLAGVRVADQRHDRARHALPLGAVHGAHVA